MKIRYWKQNMVTWETESFWNQKIWSLKRGHNRSNTTWSRKCNWTTANLSNNCSLGLYKKTLSEWCQYCIWLKTKKQMDSKQLLHAQKAINFKQKPFGMVIGGQSGCLKSFLQLLRWLASWIQVHYHENSKVQLWVIKIYKIP